jgi:(p)ppGpp synthase/HD superfamily hydrolase
MTFNEYIMNTKDTVYCYDCEGTGLSGVGDCWRCGGSGRLGIDDLVASAELAARYLHKGQKDDMDLDYAEVHLKQVFDIVREAAPQDVLLQAAAWLHDTLEDTNITVVGLEALFPKDVIDLVLEVTHEGTNDSAGYYFPRLETQRGIVLKFADRLSNLSRMDTWDERRKAQYLKRSRFWRDGSEPQFKK